jgi:hypothetical protein
MGLMFHILTLIVPAICLAQEVSIAVEHRLDRAAAFTSRGSVTGTRDNAGKWTFSWAAGSHGFSSDDLAVLKRMRDEDGSYQVRAITHDGITKHVLASARLVDSNQMLTADYNEHTLPAVHFVVYGVSA